MEVIDPLELEEPNTMAATKFANDRITFRGGIFVSGGRKFPAWSRKEYMG
jgi:hypothetical protein